MKHYIDVLQGTSKEVVEVDGGAYDVRDSNNWNHGFPDSGKVW